MIDLGYEFVARERWWEEQNRLQYRWLEDDGGWLLSETKGPKGAFRSKCGQALVRLGRCLSNLGYRVEAGAGTSGPEVGWHGSAGRQPGIRE